MAWSTFLRRQWLDEEFMVFEADEDLDLE